LHPVKSKKAKTTKKEQQQRKYRNITGFQKKTENNEHQNGQYNGQDNQFFEIPVINGRH